MIKNLQSQSPKEGDKFLGKTIIKVIHFTIPGTFQSYYEAESWIKDNGYSSGSTSCRNPVAIVKGKYNLPQKWYNISNEGLKIISGFMQSDDWREGTVTIYLFE